MHILLLPVTPHTVWTVDVPYFSIWQTLTPAPPLPTGYLQKQLANGTLSLPSPGAVNVTLRISSGWDAANPYVPVTIPVTLNPGSGSFQAEVAVPPSISMGTYTVSIMVRSPSLHSAFLCTSLSLFNPLLSCCISFFSLRYRFPRRRKRLPSSR